MELGEKIRTITIEPVTEPVPHPEPAPIEEPMVEEPVSVEEEEREKVPA